MTQGCDIIEQEAGVHYSHHSQCSSGFVKINNSVQHVLIDYTLILPWKIHVTHETTE